MKNTLFCIAAAVLFSASAEDAVREVTNPRAYPNGDANRESVEAFFHSKVSPENYNLWLGKKDRLDLNGIWKICILDSPKDFSRKTFITSGLQTIKAGDFRYTESRYGEDHAFFCEHYDDSRWFHTIVPSPLRYRFKNGEISPRIPDAWYR